MPRAIKKKMEEIGESSVPKSSLERGSVKKKVTPKRSKNTNEVSIKKEVKKKVAKKTKAVLKLHVQSDEPEVAVLIHDRTRSKNVTKVETKTIQTQVLEKPLVPSPYRFPLVPSKQALQLVTRVVAILFVIFGSLSSLFHISSVTTDLSQKANIVDSNSGTLSTTTNTQQISLDPKPNPRIVVDAGDYLHGQVPINITVPYAQEVKLMAEDRSMSRFLTMGIASRVDDSSWRFYWNTTLFQDGMYRIKLLIRNEFGTYEYGESTEYEIRNISSTASGTNSIDLTTSTTTGTTDTGQVDSIGTTTTQVTTRPELVLPSNTTISRNAVLKVLVDNATEVKLYAKNTITLTSHYIGRAIQQDTDEWRISWDSTKVPNGQYAIRAVATIGTQQRESIAKTLVVQNESSSLEVDTIPSGTTTEQVLEPTISLAISKTSPISGSVELVAETQNAQWVEVYAKQKNALTPFFLGLAQKQSDTKWKYIWDTKASPNGDYEVYVRVRSAYGFTEGRRVQTRVLNEVIATFTAEQEKEIDTLISLESSLGKETDGTVEILDNTATTTPEYIPPKIVYIEPVVTFVDRTIEEDDELREEIESTLSEFRKELRVSVSAFSSAIRTQDEAAARKAEEEILSLKREILQGLPQSGEREKLIAEVDTYLSQVIFETLELAKNNERILKERAGAAINLDADKDGITNYDEVNLYKTNPYAADTDGDGYIDSAEITKGYNPHDSSSEALVVYESPKESGEVRDDLLVVESISTVTLGEDETLVESGKDPVQALISGKGLPNSFVTLYIFSTPIVVTVRADEEGNWAYVFDKDLEEGEHTLYVGITDNAGRIVAKSNPVSFVKTAEAYSQVIGAGIVATETGEPSMFGTKAVFLLASVLVLVLGLVLVMLGMHLERKPKPEMLLASL